MGLNIVIGCHTHRERIWFYRGHLEGLESFYRVHWKCVGLVVSDDQSRPGEALLGVGGYPDVGERHGAWTPGGLATRGVVVNACYGGFSLSHVAVMAYAARKGLTLYPHFDDLSIKLFGPLTDENAADYRGIVSYYKVPAEQYKECEAKWLAEDGDYRRINSMDWYFSCRDIPRDDPDLIAVVGDLGKAASGSYANLAVVEIPVGVEWTIEEYDGSEHIAEAHRTWWPA